MNPGDQYGLVISEPGYDADTCAPENTIFDTRFDTPKADISTDVFEPVGAVSFVFATTPAVGTTRLFTIKHNLGYTPMHLTYADVTKSSAGRIGGVVVGRYYVSNDPIGLAVILVKANKTEFWFEFVRLANQSGFTLNMVGRTIFFKYFIFVNDLLQ